MDKRETRLFILLAAVIGIYLAIRAYLVPVVHDEAATFLHYLQINRYIPYFSMWDANNHLLNSALAHLSINLFSDHPFWLRLPNLLSFFVFGYYLFHLASFLQNAIVRWVLIVAMFTASFQIEFFALARGYGMSIAFFIAAIYHAVIYLNSLRLKHQWLLWTFMLLALLANMSLMNSLLIFIGMIAFELLIRSKKRLWRHILMWTIMGGILFCAGTFYALKMKALGLLYTGNTDGFVATTVFSFTRFQFQYPSAVLAWLLTLTGIISSGYLIFRWANGGWKWSPGIVVGLLLVLNAIGAISLELLLNVNYPDERTALYFQPLFILTFAFAVDATPRFQKYLIIPLLYFPLQWAATANFYTTQLWGYLHMDEAIYHKALETQKQADDPLRINTARMIELSWSYWNSLYGGRLQTAEALIYPDPTADLIVARTGDFNFEVVNPDTLFYNPQSGFALLAPQVVIGVKEQPDTISQSLKYSGNDTYFNLGQMDLKHRVHCGELSLDLYAYSGDDPLHVQLVITSQDSSGNTLSYDYVPLYWVRKKWNGENYSVKRSYQFPAAASKAIVYLWNIGGHPADIQFTDVVLREFESCKAEN